MNDNKNPNSLSNRLEEVFEHMGEINSSCDKIETFVNQEYQRLQLLINPEKDADISKEVDFYVMKFLQKLAKSLPSSDKSLH